MRLALPLTVAFTALPAYADTSSAVFFTGNMIHKSCTDKANGKSRDFAFGYTVGVLDAVGVMGGSGTMQRLPFCVPVGVTATQATDVFCKHLEDNPQDRHKAAAEMATVAFSQAWPCPS